VKALFTTSKIILAVTLLFNIAKAQDTLNFSPPLKAPIVYAIEAKDNIVVDGRLNEESWKAAPVISDFFKLQPRQGGAYLYKTFVKIVYDKKNLYFGVFCKDTAGKKACVCRITAAILRPTTMCL